MYSLKQYRKQKSNKKKSFFYVMLTLVSIVVLFFVGIQLLVSLINFISDLKYSGQVAEKSDTIPPNTPNIHTFSEFTSNENVEIKGNSEASSIIYLYLNGEKKEIVSNSDGNFVFSVNLSEGINEFYLTAIDGSGNESPRSKSYFITLDKTTPDLEISQPENNSTFYGIKNKLLEIKGKIDEPVTLKFNEKYVSPSDSGDFIFKYDLSVGENKIIYLAKDFAGNELSGEIIVYFYE